MSFECSAFRMMDFADALRAMKQGKKVTRAAWQEKQELARMKTAYMALFHFDPPFEPQLMIGYPDDTPIRPFAGAQWDILSNDWEIVE